MQRSILAVLLLIAASAGNRLCAEDHPAPAPDLDRVGEKACNAPKMPALSPDIIAGWLKSSLKLDATQAKRLSEIVSAQNPKFKRMLQLSAQINEANMQWAERFKKNMPSKKDVDAFNRLNDQFEEAYAKELGKGFDWMAEFRKATSEILTDEQRPLWKSKFFDKFSEIAATVKITTRNNAPVEGKLLARTDISEKGYTDYVLVSGAVQKINIVLGETMDEVTKSGASVLR